MLGAYGPGDPRIIGSTPFACDLCRATGTSAAPCPYHSEKTWAQWLGEAFVTIARDLVRENPWETPPEDERPLTPWERVVHSCSWCCATHRGNVPGVMADGEECLAVHAPECLYRRAREALELIDR